MNTLRVRAGGFTLIELVVVISIVAILAGLLLQRVWFYQEQAEKAAMEQVAGALQSALVLQYGSLMTHGQESEAKQLVTENPLRWLMKKPANYAGEFYGVTMSNVEPGNWAFDLKSRELVYVPYRTDYFTPDAAGNKWVRYRVRLEYEERPNRSGTAAAVTSLVGVVFEPSSVYQWLEGQ